MKKCLKSMIAKNTLSEYVQTYILLYLLFIMMFIHIVRKSYSCLWIFIHVWLGMKALPVLEYEDQYFPASAGASSFAQNIPIYSYSAPSLLIQFFITCLCQRHFGLLYVKCTDVCLDKICKTNYYFFSTVRTLWVISMYSMWA